MTNPPHLPARQPGLSLPSQARTSRLRRGLLGAGLAGLAAIWGARMLLGPVEGWAWAIAAAGFAAIWGLVVWQMRRSYPHDRIGACNVITLLRAALAMSLLAPLLGGQAAGWAVAGAAALALALDGADGWMARQQGLTSDFGARFDMETDAILALILSLHVYLGSAVGAEGLILGLARYAFVAAAVIWPWLAAPLPQRFRRKAICVLQLAALILLQLPILPPDAAIILTRLVAALLVWSFAVDILWLRERAG